MNRACVCGRSADTQVEVPWANGPRRYWYCAGCAEDVVTYVDGAEEVPAR